MLECHSGEDSTVLVMDEDAFAFLGKLTGFPRSEVVSGGGEGDSGGVWRQDAESVAIGFFHGFDPPICFLFGCTPGLGLSTGIA